MTSKSDKLYTIMLFVSVAIVGIGMTMVVLGIQLYNDWSYIGYGWGNPVSNIGTVIGLVGAYTPLIYCLLFLRTNSKTEDHI